MRNFLGTALGLVFLGMLPLTVVQAENLKIGFVNPALILDKAPQVDEANKRLEEEFAPREQEIVEIQEEIDELKSRVQKDAEIMSDDQLNKIRKKIISKTRDAKHKRDEFREDYNIRRSEELGKLQKRIYKAIESLAKEDEYDLIVSEGVIVASKRIDITEKVLRRLKQEH